MLSASENHSRVTHKNTKEDVNNFPRRKEKANLLAVDWLFFLFFSVVNYPAYNGLRFWHRQKSPPHINPPTKNTFLLDSSEKVSQNSRFYHFTGIFVLFSWCCPRKSFQPLVRSQHGRNCPFFLLVKLLVYFSQVIRFVREQRYDE